MADHPPSARIYLARFLVPVVGFLVIRTFYNQLERTPPHELYRPTVPPTKLTGKLPALGWNSWNAYRCDINEEKILAAAQQIVSLGLKNAGYEYVNIDDCWSERQRDPTTGRIVPHSTRFPNGIQSVAAKVHAMGLKIGIYSDAGSLTCERYPGSLGYELIDARTFEEWRIDYLKYDNCHVPSNWTDIPPPNGNWYESFSAIRFRRMTAALATVARPIQYDLCIWGNAHVWDWGGKVGHSWRMTKDSTPTWEFIKFAIDVNAQHLDRVGFYAHNDMDMMEIGNGKLTIEEQRTHFATWAFMKSPILLGTDLGKLSADHLAIIKNKELLEFHQDPTFGKPAMPFWNYGKTPTSPPQYYAGNSTKGVHVFIINTSSRTATKEVELASVPGLDSGERKIKVVLHDMWTGKDIGIFAESFSVTLQGHDTGAYLLYPQL